MSWILLSVSAALIWAIVNIIDKYIITKWLKTPIIPIMVQGIIGIITSIAVYLIFGFSGLSYTHIFLAGISGVFIILNLYFYLKAAKLEEISRVAPLFYINSLFVLIMALIFLDETFTPLKYSGIFLLVAGTMLISMKKSIKPDFGKAFKYIMLAALASAIYAIITKYLLNFADFWTIFSYARIGTAIILIPVFYYKHSEIASAMKKLNVKSIGVISANEILNLSGILLITIAFVTGPVTLVKVLSSIYPFFVFALAIIISIFYPKILKEKIEIKTLLLKLFAIILMFAGLVIIIY